jgi:dolichol kinase
VKKESLLGLVKLNKRNDLHLVRKLWHMGAGLTGLYAYYASGSTQREMSIYLFILSLLVLIVEVLRLRVPSVNRVAIKVMGPFMRESEVDQYSGFVFYGLGVALSLFLFPERYAILSALFLMFADPISSAVGILYGKKKFLPNKSVEGTLACAVTCYLITLLYMSCFGYTGTKLFLFSFLAGFIAAISEMLSVWIDDNLTIPVFSGLGLTVLAHFFY